MPTALAHLTQDSLLISIQHVRCQTKETYSGWRKLEALAHNTGAPGHFNLHLLGKERSEWVKTRPGTTLNPPGHPDHNAMLDRPDETWTW